ncbi:hypothetical protein AMTRI_Chr02g218460 [Amborella trichopoda]
MFSIFYENSSLHTQISAIMISDTFDFRSFICKPNSLNVPQNLGFYNLGFFSAISVIMKAPMPVQYKSVVECCRLANLSVYTCVKATTTSLFSY